MINSSILPIYQSENSKGFLGTCFVIDTDNNGSFVATCAHVINNKNNIYVDGKKAEIKENYYDKDLDIAILYVEELNAKPLIVSETAYPELVNVIGYTELLKDKPKRETINYIKIKSYIKVDKQDRIKLEPNKRDKITHGYSGAPVICPETDVVIGIIYLEDKKDNNNYIIPIKYLMEKYDCKNADSENLLSIDKFKQIKNKKFQKISSIVGHIYYLIYELSKAPKIRSITKLKIDYLYQKFDDIRRMKEYDKYECLINRLWLITYYEYANIHKNPKIYKQELNICIDFIDKCTLEKIEKSLLSNIPFTTEETAYLLGKSNNKKNKNKNNKVIKNQKKENDKFDFSKLPKQLEYYKCFKNPACSTDEWYDGEELQKLEEDRRGIWEYFYRPYNTGKSDVTLKHNEFIKDQYQLIFFDELSLKENAKMMISSIFILIAIGYILQNTGYAQHGIVVMLLFIVYKIYDSSKIISLVKSREKKILILEKEKSFLIKQIENFRKRRLSSDKIEELLNKSIVEHKKNYIKRIFNEDSNIMKGQPSIVNDVTHDKIKNPEIKSWGFLQASKQKSCNVIVARKTGINLAYKDIGNKIISWRKHDVATRESILFRFWYIQFLFFDNKNLTLVSFYYDFITNKIYNEHIESYQYNHITNYSFKDEDISYMLEDPLIKNMNIPYDLKKNIFKNELKTISLEASSGSYYRCVLSNNKIKNNINNWLEKNEKYDDISRYEYTYAEDVRNKEKENNQYKKSFKNEFYKDITTEHKEDNSEIEKTAWEAFMEIKNKVQEFAINESMMHDKKEEEKA